ncbi:MAG: putative Dnr-like transcriptional activator, partial [Burkholderiales bacterium]|nr:putative Dnr-like transcriptional activator [Burkholderiales bacterium]
LRGAAERIEHYIESEGENGRIELPRTRKAWAAELGLTHEALYRARADLRRSGRRAAQRTARGLALTLRAATPRRPS